MDEQKTNMSLVLKIANILFAIMQKETGDPNIGSKWFDDIISDMPYNKRAQIIVDLEKYYDIDIDLSPGADIYLCRSLDDFMRYILVYF